MKDERKKFTSLISPYRYCETYDDIKYHVAEEVTSRHKEVNGCLGCLTKDQSVKGERTIARILEMIGELKEIQKIKAKVQRIIGTQQKSAQLKTKEIATEDSLEIKEGILFICEDAWVKYRRGGTNTSTFRRRNG